jgi:hypothetical protein
VREKWLLLKATKLAISPISIFDPRLSSIDAQTSLLHDGMDAAEGITEHSSSSSGRFLQWIWRKFFYPDHNGVSCRYDMRVDIYD